jgi:hypothetical protein
MTEITRQETEALVQSWKNRVKALGYKKGPRPAQNWKLSFS